MRLITIMGFGQYVWPLSLNNPFLLITQNYLDKLFKFKQFQIHCIAPIILTIKFFDSTIKCLSYFFNNNAKTYNQYLKIRIKDFPVKVTVF